MSRQCSPRWEDYLLRCVMEAVDEMVAGAGISVGDLQAVVPPQISRRFVRRFMDSLPVLRTRVVDVSLENADCFTSSIPLALDQLGKRRSVQRGDLGLLLCAGAGIQIGCALYRF